MPPLIPALVAALAAGVASAETPPAKTEVADERAAVEDDGYRVHLSLPTEDDRQAWMKPGLRVELAIAEGLLLERGPAPGLGTTTLSLRARARLDRWWSLAGSFGYAVAAGDYLGTRWSAMVESMFHPLPSLGVSFGLGYGGLSVEGAEAPETGAPQSSTSRTLEEGETLSSCTGSAWVSQARVEYLLVVGALFATGPYAQADLQWTGCEEPFGRVNRETGLASTGRQWWLHAGGALGWWFSWR